MDKKLTRLDTLHLRGSDGKDYVVYAYEHLARPEHLPDTPENWTTTGLVEYKLANGTRVDADASGRMTIAGTGVALREEARTGG